MGPVRVGGCPPGVLPSLQGAEERIGHLRRLLGQNCLFSGYRSKRTQHLIIVTTVCCSRAHHSRTTFPVRGFKGAVSPQIGLSCRLCKMFNSALTWTPPTFWSLTTTGTTQTLQSQKDTTQKLSDHVTLRPKSGWIVVRLKLWHCDP
jgi:hypothetical protein